MNAQAVRRPSVGGKPSPVRRELVEELWSEFQAARLKAMTSAKVEDGIRAGRAWGQFLRAFERA